MTGLRMSRKIAERVVIAFLTVDVAATLVSLLLLLLIVFQGGVPSPDRLIEVVGALSLYGVLLWAIRDARTHRRRRSVARMGSAEEKA